MNLPNGTLLQGGKYKINRFISSGGFGCTYEAVNMILGNRIAIKESFVQSLCVRDSNTAYIQVTAPANDKNVQILKEKFIKEARILGQFNHPNIVRVSDIFQENNTAYYVMDFIEGQSLAQIVDQYGPLSETEAIRYIRQVADALRYVHAHDYLHLDIKPGNIMVDKSGKAILIDFGASKHYDSESGENTTAFKSIRSEGYAPTEQTAGFVKFSPPTDIYALGATLYKLLTGERPAEAQLLMMGEVKLKPLPRTISKSTKNAIARAMRPKRADRPQNIDEFLSLLNSDVETNQQIGNSTRNSRNGKVNDNPSPRVNPIEDAIDVTVVDHGTQLWKKDSLEVNEISSQRFAESRDINSKNAEVDGELKSQRFILKVTSIPYDRRNNAIKILRGELGLSNQIASDLIENLPQKLSRDNKQQLRTIGGYLKGIGANVQLLDEFGNSIPLNAINKEYKKYIKETPIKAKVSGVEVGAGIIIGIVLIIIGFSVDFQWYGWKYMLIIGGLSMIYHAIFD